MTTKKLDSPPKKNVSIYERDIPPDLDTKTALTGDQLIVADQHFTSLGLNSRESDFAEDKNNSPIFFAIQSTIWRMRLGHDARKVEVSPEPGPVPTARDLWTAAVAAWDSAPEEKMP
jgi:hypothetical protein